MADSTFHALPQPEAGVTGPLHALPHQGPGTSSPEPLRWGYHSVASPRAQWPARSRRYESRQQPFSHNAHYAASVTGQCTVIVRRTEGT